jgi:phenylalanyl-tRNA synthetase alpha chain
MESLHPIEKKVLHSLGKQKSASPEKISIESGLDLNAVMRALDWLSGKGLVKIVETFEEHISLGKGGEDYVLRGLPERRAAMHLEKGGLSFEELRGLMGPDEVSIAIGWLKKKNLAEIVDGEVILKDGAKAETPDENLLKTLAKGRVKRSELARDLVRWIKPLSTRKNVISLEENVSRKVSLTENGKEFLKTGGLDVEEGLGQVTPEMLRSGGWKDKKIRSYDVGDSVLPALPAKLHPLTRIIDEIKEIFIAMGFREIEGPIVESNFWNFDALFVPQDHPAREMQDTFYLERPGLAELKEEGIVKAVSRAHENGGDTGSRGWGYKWSFDLAGHTLLRTHTTATTIRELARKQSLPIKVFSIGRVFRKERISYKHLPEFHQIEGQLIFPIQNRLWKLRFTLIRRMAG